ncbi:hypothetical protein AKO1_008501 [Acrasis kona]|uniref:Uncharacterized protein n=1 Tax=Acrasis kona TaxID=1008807 RepID=A0AAW2YK94_9EUKA
MFNQCHGMENRLLAPHLTREFKKQVNKFIESYDNQQQSQQQFYHLGLFFSKIETLLGSVLDECDMSLLDTISEEEYEKIIAIQKKKRANDPKLLKLKNSSTSTNSEHTKEKTDPLPLLFMNTVKTNYLDETKTTQINKFKEQNQANPIEIRRCNLHKEQHESDIHISIEHNYVSLMCTDAKHSFMEQRVEEMLTNSETGKAVVPIFVIVEMTEDKRIPHIYSLSITHAGYNCLVMPIVRLPDRELFLNKLACEVNGINPIYLHDRGGVESRGAIDDIIIKIAEHFKMKFFVIAGDNIAEEQIMEYCDSENTYRYSNIGRAIHAGYNLMRLEMNAQDDTSVDEREKLIEALLTDGKFLQKIAVSSSACNIGKLTSHLTNLTRAASNPMLVLDLLLSDDLKEIARRELNIHEYRSQQVAQVGFAIHGPGHSMAFHNSRLNQGNQSHGVTTVLSDLVLYNLSATKNVSHVQDVFKKPITTDQHKDLMAEAQNLYNNSKMKKKHQDKTVNDSEAIKLGYFHHEQHYCMELKKRARVCFILFKFKLSLENKRTETPNTTEQKPLKNNQKSGSKRKAESDLGKQSNKKTKK